MCYTTRILNLQVVQFLGGRSPGSNGNRTDFYDCPTSGTESNGVRTNLEEINALFDQETNMSDFLCLIDESPFNMVRRAKGRLEILSHEVEEKIRNCSV